MWVTLKQSNIFLSTTLLMIANCVVININVKEKDTLKLPHHFFVEKKPIDKKVISTIKHYKMEYVRMECRVQR